MAVVVFQRGVMMNSIAVAVDCLQFPTDGNLDTADVVEASGTKLSTTQQGEPTPVSENFNAQTAVPSSSEPPAAPESDGGLHSF